MPVRNGGALISRALDSIVYQTFTDFELLISDNASTDDTQPICETYARCDRRIHYIRQHQNIGSVPNFNLLFRAGAKSKYFKWSAHDDMISPRFLEAGVTALEKDPSAILYSPGTILMEEDETPFRPGDEKDTYFDRTGKCWYWPAERHQNLGADDPADRFEAVLRTINMCFEIWGVMRSAALEQTALMGQYWGCDKVLLAELSLLGRYHTDIEPMFYWRRHDSQSMKLSFRQQGRWAGARRDKAFFQRSRKLAGYARALRGKGLTIEQHVRCWRSVFDRSIKPGRLRQLIVEASGGRM
jgi:glycosyltransferase involved in cell wall biosynthesis